MQPSSTDSVLIAVSKTKLIFTLFGCLLFVAVSLWLAIAGGDMVIQGIGLAGLLFFGGCAVYATVKFFDHRPGLVIDTEGIIDHSSALAVGRVPWSEILEVTVIRVGAQKFLCLVVSDPEKYIRQSGILARLVHWTNLRGFGSPIQISSNALKIGFAELQELVSTFRDRYGKS